MLSVMWRNEVSILISCHDSSPTLSKVVWCRRSWICCLCTGSDLKADDGGSRDALTESHRMSSYSDVQPVLQVRVYRRSTETLAMLDDRRRAQSLPRGMELNRSVGSDLQTSAPSTANSRRDSVSAAGHSSRAASRKASARSSVASISAFKGKALSTPSQKSATVAQFRRCLAVFGDSRTFLRQCGQGLTLFFTCIAEHLGVFH